MFEKLNIEFKPILYFIIIGNLNLINYFYKYFLKNFASITENFKTLWIDLKTMKDNLNYFV